MDEVEATGAETIGQLEHNIIVVTSRKSQHYYFWHDGGQRVRPFAGANVCFLGDFWQLRPTGQVSLMSNPFDRRTDGKPSARSIMNLFWLDSPPFGLQPWSENQRLLHLDVNERSEADLWFVELLVQCREANMTN